MRCVNPETYPDDPNLKSILFLITTLHEGGGQRQAVNLANILCRKYIVTIIMFFKSEIAYEIDPRIRILQYPEASEGLPFGIHSLFPELRRFLWTGKIKRKLDPIVSISYMNCANLANVISKYRDKTIVTEVNDPKNKDRKYRRQARTAFALADHIVFQSAYVQGQFSQKIQKKSTIIRNPIAVSAQSSLTRTNRIVNIGRLVPQKNQKLLIDAFNVFQKIHPDYTLEIYGTGELEQDLREQIGRLGLEGKVILRGFAPDIHEQIRDAKMFVLSSDYEGLSNALSEAMMMGIACISTKVAGSTEIIQSMDNGILTDIGDRDALTKAMLMLAEDDALRDKLQKNAAITAEQFKTENIIAQWETLL